VKAIEHMHVFECAPVDQHKVARICLVAQKLGDNVKLQTNSQVPMGYLRRWCESCRVGDTFTEEPIESAQQAAMSWVDEENQDEAKAIIYGQATGN
jgi:hypothetical protein